MLCYVPAAMRAFAITSSSDAWNPSYEVSVGMEDILTISILGDPTHLEASFLYVRPQRAFVGYQFTRCFDVLFVFFSLYHSITALFFKRSPLAWRRFRPINRLGFLIMQRVA